MYEVYSKESCSFCVKAKDELASRGLSFKVYSMESDFPDRDDFISAIKTRLPSGFELKTVPQIFKDGVHIGGYEDLLATF